jgi:hypothetical protein
VAEISNYADLTQEAKEKRIAEVDAWANAEVNSIEAFEKEQLEKRYASAEAAVYHVPVKATYSDAEVAQVHQIFRDTLDSVEMRTADPGEAQETLLELLAKAQRRKDDLLSRAVYHRGLELGLENVTQRYLSSRSHEAKNYENYIQARQEIEQANSVEALLGRAMVGQVFPS